MITPKETIDRLDKISLNDKEFRKIHHLTGTKGKNETIKSHVNYLKSIQNYQGIGSNNHIVALRLQYLEDFEGQDFKKNAIDSCIVEYPFNETS